MKLKGDSSYLQELDSAIINSEVVRPSSFVEKVIKHEVKKVTARSNSIDKDFDAHIDNEDRQNFDLSSINQHYNHFRDTQNYSRKTQRWQGYILELNSDRFVAKLEDLTKPGGTYEILEFDLSDVSPDDLPLVQIGSIFYWSIGSVMTNGQLKRQSILRFKRVALWSELDYDSATDLFDKFKENLPED